MKILRMLMIGIGATVALLGLAFYVLANHSTKRFDLTCAGNWKSPSDSMNGMGETLYASMQLYRPWVVWAEYDGNMRAETKQIALFVYVSGVSVVGEPPLVNYFFHDFNGSMTGGYRSGPKEIVLKITETATFIGNCTVGV